MSVNAIKSRMDRLRDYFLRPVLKPLAYARPDAATQLALKFRYQDWLTHGAVLPPVREAGFQAYSQTDEDGILWYLLALLGAPTKKCVEVCCGNGSECNSANLILNHGWHGLLVDGDEEKILQARHFYAQPATYVFPPKIVQSWITRDNINQVIQQAGFEGVIDVLTIDVDGVDYWLWEAVHVVKPRIVVVEYCTSLGAEPAWTVPYRDDFNAWAFSTTCGMPDYAGASLRALVALGRRKGYQLVGVNRHQFNAFFIQTDLRPKGLSELAIEDCFDTPYAQWCLRERKSKIMDLPWDEVEV